MAGASRLTLRRRGLAALAALAPLLLRPLLRLLQATSRIEYVDAEGLRARWAGGERAVLAFWHNRLLMLPIVAAGQPVCIMVSHHRDGEMATGLLGAWGVTTVRGSATRGAVGGFLRLVDAYRRGCNLAVLPDGPRGPRYVAKPGVVHLAKAVQAPIFPMAYAADRLRHLRSWDRLPLPLPFAHVVVAVGEPLSVPAGATSEELGALRAELERRLVEITAAVEARVGMPAVASDPAPAPARRAASESSPP
ncbi:MAG TPA: lysophospholipid acyltransferase family protein [Candidatus Dormibacteraeota bacterium]|nr:lysophospholipid acyltransferase family protein [Candidatus Dormibacteraeota bacterium]